MNTPKLSVVMVASLVPCISLACEDIIGLIKASESNFDSIRGGYDSYYEAYTTSSPLPGASECYIDYDSDYRNYTYHCDWESQDSSSARTAYDEILSLTRNCLRHYSVSERKYNYPRRERRSSISGPTESISFYSGSEFEKVSVSLTQFTSKRRNQTRYTASFSLEQTEN